MLSSSRAEVRVCSSITSLPFRVYTGKLFPGMEGPRRLQAPTFPILMFSPTESSRLSCSLASQSVKLRIRKDVGARRQPIASPTGPATAGTPAHRQTRSTSSGTAPKRKPRPASSAPPAKRVRSDTPVYPSALSWDALPPLPDLDALGGPDLPSLAELGVFGPSPSADAPGAPHVSPPAAPTAAPPPPPAAPPWMYPFAYGYGYGYPPPPWPHHPGEHPGTPTRGGPLAAYWPAPPYHAYAPPPYLPYPYGLAVGYGYPPPAADRRAASASGVSSGPVTAHRPSPTLPVDKSRLLRGAI
jgi:hypothetical protein